MSNPESEAQCCPKFDPEPWQEKEVEWHEKLFIKETLPQFWHAPLPGTMGKAVHRMWRKIEDARAKPDMCDFLMLSAETSPWRGELYIAVTKEVPNAQNVKLSGAYLTKVFDGPYQDVPKWAKSMDLYVKEKGKSVKNYYFYFTTCPKCARKYGHNYVVVYAEI